MGFGFICPIWYVDTSWCTKPKIMIMVHSWKLLRNNMFTFCLHSVIEHMVLSFLWCDEVDWGLGKYWRILKAVKLSFRNTVPCTVNCKFKTTMLWKNFIWNAFSISCVLFEVGWGDIYPVSRVTLTEVFKITSFMFQIVKGLKCTFRMWRFRKGRVWQTEEAWTGCGHWFLYKQNSFRILRTTGKPLTWMRIYPF